MVCLYRTRYIYIQPNLDIQHYVQPRKKGSYFEAVMTEKISNQHPLHAKNETKKKSDHDNIKP